MWVIYIVLALSVMLPETLVGRALQSVCQLASFMVTLTPVFRALLSHSGPNLKPTNQKLCALDSFLTFLGLGLLSCEVKTTVSISQITGKI